MAKFRFRLLFGNHVDWHPDDLDKPPLERREMRYQQNSIIVTDQDLSQYNGRAGDARKFEMLSEDGSAMGHNPLTWDPARESIEQFTERMRSIGAVREPEPNLTAIAPAERQAVPVGGIAPPNIQTMTIQQLRSYAEAEEIKLDGVKTRDEMIRVITEALSPATA